MKIAYHFLTKHPDIRGLYNVHVLGEFLQIVLQHPTLGLHTKVFTGDLALKNLGMIEAPGVHGTVGSFNREKFSDALNQWAFPASGVWSRMTMEALEACSTNDVYAVCIESVEEEDADDLHRRLISLSYYLGAMEVDDSSAVHWRIYSYGLDAAYRLMGRAANVFWQAFDPETKPAYQVPGSISSSVLGSTRSSGSLLTAASPCSTRFKIPGTLGGSPFGNVKPEAFWRLSPTTRLAA